ncbi:MAG TPA: preprotein translocase subunit SecE [Pseudomonadales bacterium]|nr:preprotein translocase subunit SecE [Pseudomonadales bacterium]
MSTNTEAGQSQSIIDWLVWTVVALIVAGGVFGNWYYQDQSLLYRVLALLALAAVAGLLTFQTNQGKALLVLIKESRVEIRRVVWPTRQETTQTTLIVVALVLIFSLVLWLLDSGLSWVVSSLIG